MNTTTIGSNLPLLLVYGVSLIVVMWCVVDAMRRPPQELPPGKKAAWVIATLVGWLLFGIMGAAIAVFYLLGPRKKMNADRW
jgi:hypothetical protein